MKVKLKLKKFEFQELLIFIMGKKKETWFHIIQKRGISLEKLVDDWIKEFNKNEGSAIILFLQFIIDSCGCDYKLENYDNMTDIVDAMVNKLCKMEKYKCPLMESSLSKKTFYNNYCELVQLILKKCKNSIIYNQEFIPRIVQFIVPLSKLHNRQLRFVGTLTGLKLCTGITSVFYGVSESISTINSQLSDQPTNISAEKIARHDTLSILLNEQQENYEFLHKISDYLMKSIFNHRFRDVSKMIRSLCLSELGLWIEKFPDLYLKDDHLKYLGWMLYDKVHDVRMSCVQALLKIYIEENFSQLQQFTKKYKQKLIYMTWDKSISVSVVAFQILLQIDKFPHDVFNDEDTKMLFSLVFSKHEAVAKIAGKFFLQRMGRTDLPLLQNISYFLKDPSYFARMDYFVKILWENCNLLQDWALLTNMLPHSEDCNTVLAELLLSCVRNITSNQSSHLIKNKKRSQIKDEANIIASQATLMDHLLERLPILYDSLRNDADTLEILLRIPLLFKLNDTIITKNQVQFNCLLDKLLVIMSECHDDQILENCGKIFHCFNKEDNPAFNICNVKVNMLANNLTKKFGEAIERWSGINDEDRTEDDLFEVETCVKKVVTLYCWFNMSSWEIWHNLLKVLTMFVKNPSLRPQEVANLCMKGCVVGLLWDRRTWSGSKKDEEKVSKNLNIFVEVLEEIMNQEETVPFQKRAFSSICDLAFAFSPLMSEGKSFIFIPNKYVESSLLLFVNSYIFNNESDESTIHLTLQDKKLFLRNFCNLLATCVISSKGAILIFQYYIKFERDFGEIITELFVKMKEYDCRKCASIILKCLFMLFKSLDEENNADLKNLANKFASKFEYNERDTAAVMELHKKGISYALKQETDTSIYPYIGFCNILHEFVPKLRPSDAKSILLSLEEKLPTEIIEKNEVFQHIVAYKKIVLQWSKSKKGTDQMKRSSKEVDRSVEPQPNAIKKKAKTEHKSSSVRKSGKISTTRSSSVQSSSARKSGEVMSKRRRTLQSSSAQKSREIIRKRRRTVQSLDVTAAEVHHPLAMSSPMMPLSGTPTIDDASP